MAGETLTRMDLAEAVFEQVGLSRNESADLVESVLQHISDSLVRGENVKISSFGTFNIRDKNSRVGRNPKTGEEVVINPRRVLSFRPSLTMKDRVAAGNKK
ncbi:integration host factor subunit alpha [Amylibacter marinus]|uniref:Integration host factor subunit alpha n=1 Tax=Amylibacter marinus TaxID=1475483 RepID=A0ABQ5VUE7_9RHOB|nr:integration host factor subunit alpha [Amylibacter marinus]GLQ34802.1 integration host factor subunit alpha [Amylibacter marinus]